MMAENATQILNASQIAQKIERMAWQVQELSFGHHTLLLAGIVPKGNILAERLAIHLQKNSPQSLEFAQVKLNKVEPTAQLPQISVGPEQLENRFVVLIDDVLNTGSTLIYGMQAFLTAPIAGLITVVMVDRDHHRWPVRADVKGLSLSTTLKEHIEVVFEPEAGVYLF